MNKDVYIGTKNISLNAIDTQNEYTVDISILDHNDKILAVINSKITFFWSDYLILRDQMAKIEKRMNKIKENISKSHMYITMMNNPINMFMTLEDQYKQPKAEADEADNHNSSDHFDVNRKQEEYVDYGINRGNDNNNRLKGRMNQTPLDRQLNKDSPSPILTKIEDVIKKTFSKIK